MEPIRMDFEEDSESDVTICQSPSAPSSPILSQRKEEHRRHAVDCSTHEFAEQLKYRNIIWKFDFQINQGTDHLSAHDLTDLRSAINAERESETAPDLSLTMTVIAHEVPNKATLTHTLLAYALDLPTMMIAGDRELVLNAQWIDDPIPSPVRTESCLPAPKPDLTIGYSLYNLCHYSAIYSESSLESRATPVVCAAGLFFPVFTTEVECFESVDLAKRRNQNNCAIMLRNLYHLKDVAEAAGFQHAPDTIKVLSAVMTTDIVRVSVHCKSNSSFLSSNVKSWLTCGEEWHGITNGLKNAIDVSLDMNREWIRGALQAIEVKEDMIRKERENGSEYTLLVQGTRGQ